MKNHAKSNRFDETRCLAMAPRSAHRVEPSRGWCPTTGTWLNGLARVPSREEADQQTLSIRKEIAVIDDAHRKLRAGVEPDDLPQEVFAYLSKDLVRRARQEMRRAISDGF